MNVQGKTQRMKRYLESKGLAFPASVDQGEMTNRQNNVFRARLIRKVVLQAMRRNDLSNAEEALSQMMTLLAQTRIRDPLVELDLTAHLIADNIKVTRSAISQPSHSLIILQVLFLQNGSAARKKAQLWADMAPMFHLLSTQLV